jgi:hypothetical protein
VKKAHKILVEILTPRQRLTWEVDKKNGTYNRFTWLRILSDSGHFWPSGLLVWRPKAGSNSMFKSKDSFD